MASLKHWIVSARLRTLPLSFSSILAGNSLALAKGVFNWSIFILTLLTTLFLQILSNFANDYGDAKHGADHSERKGPDRMVSSGKISDSQMKLAIIIFSVLSFLSGVTLLFISFSGDYYLEVGVLLLLGIASIWAAIKYTAGKNPYGYIGLGDLFVLLFFGFVGILGSMYLQSKNIEWTDLYLTFGIGFLAVAVLNVNNMRDINSDKTAGKMSIPVRIGLQYAKGYHSFLILGAALGVLIWLDAIGLRKYSYWISPLLIILVFHLIKVWRTTLPEKLDPQLKIVALSSFLISLLIFLIHWI